MIAIFNTGGDTKGVSNYQVQINDTFICKFKHNRPDGLAECLRKAAEAVDNEKKDMMIMLTKEMEKL